MIKVLLRLVEFAQARHDVIRYIEGFYNSKRRHSGLGYRRPNEVHYGWHQPVAAA